MKFDDGEFEEFTNDEMRAFQTVKHFTPRQPTIAANQIIVNGCHPKASTGNGNGMQVCPMKNTLGSSQAQTVRHADDMIQLGMHDQPQLRCGLNAGSVFNQELN